MGSNTLPQSSSDLINLGTQMLGGLNSLGSALHITQITPASFGAVLSAFSTADGAYNAGRSARQGASDGFQAVCAALSEWLGVTRNILAGQFGNRWSTLWTQAGFISPSTAVPSRLADRLGLALSLSQFFTANPGYQVASMDVTASEAAILRDAALSTQQALTDATVALGGLAAADGSTRDALVAAMRALIKILGATLSADDPRWQAFGLNIPASDSTPGQPVNVTAMMSEEGGILVQCDAVPLATRYRWRILMVGVDTDYQLAASDVPPMALIEGIMPGQTLNIIVQAVNNGTQGMASEPIVFTVPVAETQAAPKSAPAAKSLAIGNGKGIGNGHALHSRAV